MEAFRKLEFNTHHYGLSTRSLFTLMAERGPSYLHAGTNSETGLLATNKYQADILRFPMVFIFPSDGTFWSDNPFCLLDAGWVTDEQRAAAEIYRDYLLQPEQQDAAVTIGLRPVSAGIPLHAPIALENGTDPRVSPQTIPALASVSGNTAAAIKNVFHQTKKKASIVVVLDTSGSMKGEKIQNAVAGTANFLNGLDRDDRVSVYTFSSTVQPLQPLARAGDVVEQLSPRLLSLQGAGSTVLYDAVCQAVMFTDQLKSTDNAAEEKRLYGVVVLSDGQDTLSEKTKQEMLSCLPTGEDVEGVKVFTIAYGDQANEELLQQIAARTNGKFFTSDPENIDQVYLAISMEQ